MKSFWRAFAVGHFLAWRQLKRSSLGTTILIVSVMTLTFLNLVVITGILVGLIEGSVRVNKDLYTGDIIVSTLPNRTYIDQSPRIMATIRSLPEVSRFTSRYLESGSVEANYQAVRRGNELPNRVGTLIAGIDPLIEDQATNLSSKIIEGEYLSPTDTDEILIGADKLAKYLPIESPGLETLKNVEIGSKVRMTIGDSRRVYTIKGILRSKVGEVDNRVFMNATLLRAITNRFDYAVDEIAIKLKDGANPIMVKDRLLAAGVGDYARVQTSEEAEPKFLKDIKNTFALLGNVIGSIGLAVASITIFIVIFVNAITRRKYIGILKGIGIEGLAIEISYIMQAIFYALAGIIIGIAILYGLLVPFFNAHPINFPFSDGILVATVSGTLIRALVLLVATIVAGYIPAKLIIRQNTLDAILGRK